MRKICSDKWDQLICLDEGKSSNRGAKKRRTYSNPPSRKIRRRLLDVFFSILLGEIALGLEPELQLHSFRSPACFPEFIGAKSYRFQVQSVRAFLVPLTN